MSLIEYIDKNKKIVFLMTIINLKIDLHILHQIKQLIYIF